MNHLMPHVFLILLTILIACYPVTSQTAIIGTVTDQSTNLPVADVNIYISGTLSGTVSGPNGTFMLISELAPPLQLVFSHIGYRELSNQTTFIKQSA